MLKRLVILLVLVSMLAVLGGCASNTSQIKPTRSWRRVTIAGEGSRNTLESVDRVLGIDQYPRDSRWSH